MPLYMEPRFPCLSKALDKLEVTGIGVENFKAGFPFVILMLYNSYHCSHEGRIHYRAVFQIDHKLCSATFDHAQGKFLAALHD